jgi:hypothetical protein
MNSPILRAVNGVISEGYEGSGDQEYLALLAIGPYLEDNGVSGGKSRSDLRGEHNLSALIFKVDPDDHHLTRTKGKFQGVICPFDGDIRARRTKGRGFSHNNTVGFMSGISKSRFVRL